MSINRVPKGVANGGQYAEGRRAESAAETLTGEEPNPYDLAVSKDDKAEAKRYAKQCHRMHPRADVVLWRNGLDLRGTSATSRAPDDPYGISEELIGRIEYNTGSITKDDTEALRSFLDEHRFAREAVEIEGASSEQTVPAPGVTEAYLYLRDPVGNAEYRQEAEALLGLTDQDTRPGGRIEQMAAAAARADARNEASDYLRELSWDSEYGENNESQDVGRFMAAGLNSELGLVGDNRVRAADGAYATQKRMSAEAEEFKMTRDRLFAAICEESFQRRHPDAYRWARANGLVRMNIGTEHEKDTNLR